jgi:hypothetical protein
MCFDLVKVGGVSLFDIVEADIMRDCVNNGVLVLREGSVLIK